MPTTPTSLVNRLMGAETWTDAVNFGTAAHTFGGAVAFTGTPVFSNAVTFGGIPAGGTVAPVDTASGTTTLTLSPGTHANRLLTIHSTGGLAVTPPAATGTGNVYTFFCTATLTGGSFTFDAKAGNASDVMAGTSFHVLSGGVTVAAAPTASNSNLFTWNGTTTGGVAGSLVTFTDAKTNLWIVEETALNTSTSATPFSNH